MRIDPYLLPTHRVEIDQAALDAEARPVPVRRSDSADNGSTAGNSFFMTGLFGEIPGSETSPIRMRRVGWRRPAGS